MLRRIAVFGNASELPGPDELIAAQRVGRLLGDNGIVVVYDGSATGALGTLADAAVAAGGRVIGVAPAGQPGPFRDDLAERHETTAGAWRAELAARVDAWLGLPGAWARLEDPLALLDVGAGGRELPLGLLDEGDFYSALLREASDAAVDRFVAESQRGRLVVARSAAELLRRLAEYRPPETRRDQPFDED